MVRTLEWLNANGDGLQAIGAILAYLIALKGVADFAIRWFRRHRQLKVYIDHHGDTMWSVHLRYLPTSRLRHYARVWPVDRQKVGLVVADAPASDWLPGLPGEPPVFARELFGPHHIPLAPVSPDSALVGCTLFVSARPHPQPWRLRLEIRDHDTDRLLMASKITPSKAVWMRDGTIKKNNNHQN